MEGMGDFDADGTGGGLFGYAREGELDVDGEIVSEEGGFGGGFGVVFEEGGDCFVEEDGVHHVTGLGGECLGNHGQVS